jgi:hypothetical protein
MAFMAPALSAIGEGAATAASTVGSALGSAAGEVGSLAGEAGGALGSVGQGLQSLVGAPSEAGYLQSLGQAVPQGVELAGPSSTFAGPGFAGGLVQGLLGTLQQSASPSAATQLGGGIGQLASYLQQIHGGGAGTKLAPVVNAASTMMPSGPATKVLPASTPGVGQGPIMKLIGQLFAGF